MSADNGVYVLSTPAANGSAEFRVAVAQCIENARPSPMWPMEVTRWWLAAVFGKSPGYGETEAWRTAFALEKEYKENGWILEYGVQAVHLDIQFPCESVTKLGEILNERHVFP